MAGDQSKDSFYTITKIAMVISVVTAVAVMGYLYLINDDTYSALYLIPESYSGYQVSDNVSFVYGVKCFEGKKTGYNVKIYYDDSIYRTDFIELGDRESIEKQEIIRLPEDIKYPAKVNIVLENGNTTEHVHFWLKE